MVAIVQVLNTSLFPTGLNPTFITLISKKNQVVKVAAFRLVSFCNILYKLISKVITNWLKMILPSIIFDS